MNKSISYCCLALLLQTISSFVIRRPVNQQKNVRRGTAIRNNRAAGRYNRAAARNNRVAARDNRAADRNGRALRYNQRRNTVRNKNRGNVTRRNGRGNTSRCKNTRSIIRNKNNRVNRERDNDQPRSLLCLITILSYWNYFNRLFTESYASTHTKLFSCNIEALSKR